MNMCLVLNSDKTELFEIGPRRFFISLTFVCGFRKRAEITEGR